MAIYHVAYELVHGPFVWGAFAVFTGASLFRLISAFRTARKKDPIVYTYFSGFYAARSLLHWVIPFGSTGMRRHPFFTLVAFIFHIALLLTPLFLFAHIIQVKESWNLSWWYMPDRLADVLTLTVIFACGFFFIRRLIVPEVKYLSSIEDYLLLLLVAAPYLTGFWAYHRWAGNEIATLLHMFSAELLLAAIPFTRLSHILFFPFTRGYAGSEFGAVRHARDW